MEKEKIERAAIELCTTEGQEEWVKDYGVSCFKNGARWRIDSAWHDSDEEPEERKEILVEYRFMTPAGEMEVRKEVVESLDDLSDIYCDVLNWAYLDDLLPESKEE